MTVKRGHFTGGGVGRLVADPTLRVDDKGKLHVYLRLMFGEKIYKKGNTWVGESLFLSAIATEDVARQVRNICDSDKPWLGKDALVEVDGYLINTSWKTRREGQNREVVLKLISVKRPSAPEKTTSAVVPAFFEGGHL